MATVFVAAGVALLVMTIVWLGACAKVFSILRTRHAAKYASMGNPSLIMNNSLGTNLALMRFLWRREDSGMGDAGLTSLTTYMRWHFVVHMALFVFLIIGFFSIQTSPGMH